MKCSWVRQDIGEVGIADISTTNAKIEGKLYCAHAMDVKTSNAPIEVSLTVANDDPENPTQVSLNTSNGYVPQHTCASNRPLMSS